MFQLLKKFRVLNRFVAIPLFAAALIASGCNAATQEPAQTESTPNQETETPATPPADQTESGTAAQDARDEHATPSEPPINPVAENNVRFATFNVHMYRKQEGGLIDEMANGDSAQARQIAEVIQITRPDVILLNEFDYDPDNAALEGFLTNYLAISQNGNEPIEYPYFYNGPVNTGVATGIDLDGNGKEDTPNDAYGFGFFPGQYGMVVLSRYEIDLDSVRTFRQFLWKDMPGAIWPVVPETGKPYYPEASKEIFRLSSKSHWDVPVKVGDETIHFLTSHPTPPVFDQEEDRNGCRNHDEIRMFADYVSGNADYLYDDSFTEGGLAAGSHFIIAGDLNADPLDGDSRDNAAGLLTGHPEIQAQPVPVSAGGKYHATGAANEEHSGDPAADTGVFGSIGNMRIDYCLPSKTLTMTANGVFWPVPGQPGAEAVEGSDHRMVWIDIEK